MSCHVVLTGSGLGFFRLKLVFLCLYEKVNTNVQINSSFLLVYSVSLKKKSVPLKSYVDTYNLGPFFREVNNKIIKIGVHFNVVL